MRFLIIGLFSLSLFSQELSKFIETKKMLLSFLKKDFELYNNNLSKNKIASKTLLKFHKNQQKLISNNIKAEVYFFEGKHQFFLEEIVSQLIKENPQELINRNIRVFVSSSILPNAANIGYNILLVNKGLFSQLESKEQVKAIIAHELSHLILNHHEKVIEKRVENIISDNYKKDISSIKLNNPSNTKLLKLYKKYRFGFASFKRKQEFEADSLSLKLLKETKDNFSLLKVTLNKISENYSFDFNKLKSETIKNMAKNILLDVNEKWFLKNYQPQKEIENKEKGLELNRDSIRTHPKLEQRLNHLEKIYKIDILKLKTKYVDLIEDNQKEFLNLKEASYLEAAVTLNSQKRYFESLYYNLLQYQDFSNFGLTNDLVRNNFNFFLDLKNQNKLEAYFNFLEITKNNKDYILLINFLLHISKEELTGLISNLE